MSRSVPVNQVDRFLAAAAAVISLVTGAFHYASITRLERVITRVFDDA